MSSARMKYAADTEAIRTYKIRVNKDVFIIVFIDGNTVEVVSENSLIGDYIFNFSFDSEGRYDDEILDIVYGNIENGNVALFDDWYEDYYG